METAAIPLLTALMLAAPEGRDRGGLIIARSAAPPGAAISSRASPVSVGGSVLFGTTGGKVFEIDADSLSILGAFQLSDAVTNAVAVSPDGRRLYVSTAMNALVCVERLETSAPASRQGVEADTGLASAHTPAHVVS